MDNKYHNTAISISCQWLTSHNACYGSQVLPLVSATSGTSCWSPTQSASHGAPIVAAQENYQATTRLLLPVRFYHPYCCPFLQRPDHTTPPLPPSSVLFNYLAGTSYSCTLSMSINPLRSRQGQSCILSMLISPLPSFLYSDEPASYCPFKLKFSEIQTTSKVGETWHCTAFSSWQTL